jgi:kinesin family protein 18/19
MQQHAEANVLVCVRVRPRSESEFGKRNLVDIVDDSTVVFDPETSAMRGEISGVHKRLREGTRRNREQCFKFDRVFGPSSTQQQIFEFAAKGVIDNVMNGMNGTVFAYGATGSGKTHTMIGNEEVGAGVMVLSVRDIFAKMEERKLSSTYKVCISYLEVYNETIRDLLVPSGPLALRESFAGCQVAGLTKHYPANDEEVFKLIRTGNSNRCQSPTEANSQSSRSHAVLQIAIEKHDRGAGIKRAIKTGKLSLIDLAGSERASASANRGQLLKEGANINKSLLALSSCINALCKSGEKIHVPFRNSKLTRLLKDSLGGNCRTVMISNISPAGLNYEDTLNTLKYANRAKEIKTKVTANVVSVNMHVSQ